MNISSGSPGSKEERRARKERKRQRREERRRRLETDEATTSPLRKRGRVETSSHSQPDIFVWKKKIELQRKRGTSHAAEDEHDRREELQRELEDAKRRREQRDRERAEREAEQLAEAREREAQLNEGWHNQEASFHGRQHFLRQRIRLREQRPKQIDALASYLRLDLDADVGVLDIDDFLGQLSSPELDEIAIGLEEELDFAIDFPTLHDNHVWNRAIRLEFWENVRVCVKHWRAKLHREGEDYSSTGMHASVTEEVETLLQGKAPDKLHEMETEIRQKLENREEGFAERDFWTAALSRIQKKLASERARTITMILLSEREKRGVEKPRTAASESHTTNDVAHEDDELAKMSGRGEESDEEKFDDEVEVPAAKRRPSVPGYAWNDKYRPRKPKYFNRVYTGYNWTKYNRTHYDHDNPPPKTVQGYKFNMFYPDLIDPTKTPTFSISKTENLDVAIITFTAGPPYQDIAFKIVNRPWERSHRRGFKCSFDRGILHLWFHFQRYRYRR